MKTSQNCIWVILCTVVLLHPIVEADDGYDLWLKYRKVDDSALLNAYRERLSSVIIPGNSDTHRVIREEVVRALGGLLDVNVSVQKTIPSHGGLIIATVNDLPVLKDLAGDLASLGDEGYLIRTAKIKGTSCLVITANQEIGLLYGSFHLLRLVQTGQSINELDIRSRPRIQYRLLNHWDNLEVRLNGAMRASHCGSGLNCLRRLILVTTTMPGPMPRWALTGRWSTMSMPIHAC